MRIMCSQLLPVLWGVLWRVQSCTQMQSALPAITNKYCIKKSVVIQYRPSCSIIIIIPKIPCSSCYYCICIYICYSGAGNAMGNRLNDIFMEENRSSKNWTACFLGKSTRYCCWARGWLLLFTTSLRLTAHTNITSLNQATEKWHFVYFYVHEIVQFHFTRNKLLLTCDSGKGYKKRG